MNVNEKDKYEGRRWEEKMWMKKKRKNVDERDVYG